MPRSYQAYPQNAVVTHSPVSNTAGDPSSAIQAAKTVFSIPSLLDICSGVTNGTQNPFMSGLNTMGSEGGNTSGVPGQTGNMLTGVQTFADSLCGFALGGTGVSEVLEAARQLRREGGDLHETLEAVRRLRATVVHGTTPQTVLSGVGAVTAITKTNPAVQGAIAQGQAAAGISGNQIIDGINGAQVYTGQGNQLLTGIYDPNASGDQLLTASNQAINQNTALHFGNQSMTAAQSVNLVNQNLLVSQDFSSAYTIVGDTHWSWDGTDSSPGSPALGCAKVTCDGSQHPLLSSEILVVAGETIEVSAFVKWSGLTYTGSNPIILSVEKYRLMKDPAGSGRFTYTDVGWYPVYKVPSPGASSAGFTGAKNGWLGIAGTYTVEAGVDQLRFRLEVANTTAGTVKWDEAEFLKLDMIPDAAVPSIGDVRDSIVVQLYGQEGEGFTNNDAAVALASTKASITSVAAQVANLTAEGSTGSIAGDDFNWTGPILSNANWGGSYRTPGNGSYVANGTDAAWVAAGGQGGQAAFFKWQGTDPVSTTDYQLVQTVLDSPPTAFSTIYSSTWLFGRIASDWSSYVRLGIGSDGTYALHSLSGGVLSTIISGSCAVPGAGAVISLYLGDKASATLRNFRVKLGDTNICVVTEAGTTSVVGSGNRGYGWGGSSGYWIEQGFFSYQTGYTTPPKVNQWLGLDQ